MLVSLAWLKKYVETPDDLAAFSHDLTMAGLNVERLTERGISDPNIVTGRVLSAEKHPNADKLKLCTVDAGDGKERQIVCGAPNVDAGQNVLVALPGAKLPDGLKIRSSKIRGVKSDGMICSERELGIGEDTGGIMVLDGDPKPGTPITEVLSAPDTVLEIEVTPNRPDMLSHVGIAREVAAIYDKDLALPYNSGKIADAGKAKKVSVSIQDANDCARYVGKLVRGVKVGPSPDWLVNALEAVGLQSRNTIVDITNFVLMELGQPIHAFDFKKLRGGEIIVRRAEEGEKLLTLDGTEAELTPDMLIIADERDPVALAGVIGGEESAVHDDTVDVLIESANFHPTLVRKCRSALGVSTDASYRFERGADREMCRIAAERAAELMIELGGGEAVEVVDMYPGPLEKRTLELRRSATRRILGTRVSTEDMTEILGRLHFDPKAKGEDVKVTVPSWRADVVEEMDLIEEVARLYGYERIGEGWDFRATTYGVASDTDRFVGAISNHLTSRGYTEVIASSFTDGRELDDFGWAENDIRRSLVPVRNPLTSQHTFLKTSLIPGMLDIVRRNLDYGVRRIQIYQVGKVFLAPEATNQLPDEKRQMAMVTTRPAGTEFWNNTKSEMDLFDIKGEIEHLLGVLKVDPSDGLYYDFDRSSGSFAWRRKEDAVIEGGIVTDEIARRYDFEQPIWYATFDLKMLYRIGTARPKLRPLPEYPVSRRDLSLLVKDGVEFRDIEKHLVKSAGRLLESHQVFDVYRGNNVAKDHSAYGIRLSFRSAERTLTDGEVDQVIDKILGKLKNELGVELRAQ